MKQKNYIKGMIMIILSAFFFACMNVSVRLAGNLPSVEKSFFRNLVAAVFAAVILCKDHTLPKVNKKYWGPLILRCVCGTMGILCNFYALFSSDTFSPPVNDVAARTTCCVQSIGIIPITNNIAIKNEDTRLPLFFINLKPPVLLT